MDSIEQIRKEHKTFDDNETPSKKTPYVKIVVYPQYR